MTVHSGAMCLMAGGLNYMSLTWTCLAGDARQRWTVTAAGELRSPTGYCLTGYRSGTSSSVQLQLCNGGAAQRWTR